MKVFITGGSGYIGRSTIAALIRHGIEVTALARSERSARTVSDLGATPLAGALTDTDVPRETAGRADGVIHLGVDYSEGTADVDRAAAEAMQDGAGSRPYVHTGGVWVYGDTGGVVDEDAPLNPPGITAWRLDNEKRVLARAATGEHPVVVMPGLVYGRCGGLAQSFFVEPGCAVGAVPCTGDGSAHWALVHVDDIAELYVLALNAPAGAVYAGVGGQNLPLADITVALSHAAGCPGRIDCPWTRPCGGWARSPRRSPSTSSSPGPGPSAGWAGRPPGSTPWPSSPGAETARPGRDVLRPTVC